jgi:phage protein U
MYAVLGEIIFGVLTSPQAFAAARKYDYAEHKVVQDRPRLQWIAADLETLTLELSFHAQFTNPQRQLTLLENAAEDHRARAFVYGNGIHRGYFVVSELTEVHRHNADDGSLIYATARVTLKEWALSVEVDPSAPPKPSAPPPAIVRAPAGTTSPAGFNPNLPPSPHNLVPISALVTIGSLPAGSYAPAQYNVPGASPIVSNPAVAAPPNATTLAGDIAPNSIVGSPS